VAEGPGWASALIAIEGRHRHAGTSDRPETAVIASGPLRMAVATGCRSIVAVSPEHRHFA